MALPSEIREELNRAISRCPAESFKLLQAETQIERLLRMPPKAVEAAFQAAEEGCNPYPIRALQ